MKGSYLWLLSGLFALSARAEATGPAPDAGALDWVQLDSRAREREAHLRQAQAFEARAKLEREMAAKQIDPEIRQKLLEQAKQLSALAAKERELLSPIK